MAGGKKLSRARVPAARAPAGGHRNRDRSKRNAGVVSKILEALKTHAGQGPRNGLEEPKPKEVRIEKSAHELTQEQLADIYFSATGKPRTVEPPVIIRLIERPRLATYIPWVLACLAFAATLLSLFSTKRVLIDVKVLDEKTAAVYGLGRNPTDPDAAGVSGMPETAQENTNRFESSDFAFEGAAYLNSSKDRNGTLTLINSSVAPFARASLRLDPPLDLSGARIVFYAKGGRGGENIAVALKDEENIQGFYRGKLFPFPDKLSTSWKKAEIVVGQDTAKDFDPQRVTQMRFDFGSKDTGNKPGDLILIKDLQWITKE